MLLCRMIQKSYIHLPARSCTILVIVQYTPDFTTRTSTFFIPLSFRRVWGLAIAEPMRWIVRMLWLDLQKSFRKKRGCLARAIAMRCGIRAVCLREKA